MICTRGHVLTSWDQVRLQEGRSPRCKICTKEAKARRKQLMPAVVKAQQAKWNKAYRRRHPKKVQAASMAWLAENRESRNAKMREYMRRKRAEKRLGSVVTPRDVWSEDAPIGGGR